MDAQRIVNGQFVRPEKRAFSRQLRREMTPEERCLWQQLRGKKAGGFKFRRQQVIDGYIADFSCAEAGLVVELDGGIHNLQARFDQQRDAVLAARGLTVVRLPNERINNDLARTVDELMTLCQTLCAPMMGKTTPPQARNTDEE